MNYNEQIQDVLNRYDMGMISNVAFVYELAWARLNSGDTTGKSILNKAEGIVKTFANRLVIRLLGADNAHVTGEILNFVEEYINGARTPMKLILDCRTEWDNSVYIAHKEFAKIVDNDLNKAFYSMADLLYSTECEKLQA